MSLRLDFAREIRPARRPGMVPILLLAICVVAVGSGAHRAWKLDREEQTLRQALNTVATASASARPASTPAANNLKGASREPSVAQAQAINAAVAQLNLPWRDLFDTVGSAMTPRIALLSVEPDGGRRVVRITGEARTLDDMLDFRQRLGQLKFFTVAVVLSHERQAQDPERPVRFSIEARWPSPAQESRR